MGPLKDDQLTDAPGICLSFVKQLLEGGCSVMMADIKLRPEAQELLDKYTTTDGSKPAAFYHQTDISDWAQISSLWTASLAKLGQIDIVCNGAGIYEPPSSTFWNAPGVSPLAEDKANCSPGVYKTFSVNTMGPIRLAQIAVDYWLQNREVEGNLLWIASLGGYVHSLQTPLYFASKAAIVSVVKSFANFRAKFGIRNSAVCPGAVYVSRLIYIASQKSFESVANTDPCLDSHLPPRILPQPCPPRRPHAHPRADGQRHVQRPHRAPIRRRQHRRDHAYRNEGEPQRQCPRGASACSIPYCWPGRTRQPSLGGGGEVHEAAAGARNAQVVGRNAKGKSVKRI